MSRRDWDLFTCCAVAPLGCDVKTRSPAKFLYILPARMLLEACACQASTLRRDLDLDSRSVGYRSNSPTDARDTSAERDLPEDCGSAKCMPEEYASSPCANSSPSLWLALLGVLLSLFLYFVYFTSLKTEAGSECRVLLEGSQGHRVASSVGFALKKWHHTLHTTRPTASRQVPGFHDHVLSEIWKGTRA